MILRLGHWPCPSPEHREASLAVPGTGLPFVERGQPRLCMRPEICGNGLCFRERGGGSYIQPCPCWNQRPLCRDAGCSGTPQTPAPTVFSLFHSFVFYLQELTWTQILGHPWSVSSSVCESGRNFLRTFYSQRQSSSSLCPTYISRHRDVSPGGEGLE